MSLPNRLPWDSASGDRRLEWHRSRDGPPAAAHGVGRLVLVARRVDRLDQLAAELRENHGTEVELLPADLAEPGPLAAVEARLADPDRPIDLLVNNAGLGTLGPLHSLPADGEEREIRVNVVALVRLTRAVLPGLLERAQGRRAQRVVDGELPAVLPAPRPTAPRRRS